ncbi:MAG: zinc-binding alcohol dehydrogenase [Parasporobacterium sp.]|nr:zinc-binding alcohol dehydrogenase [Parasporobacterium sp.]
MKTIYSEAQPGKVVLKEKEIGHPGPGEVLVKAMYSTLSPGTECGLLHEAIVPLPTCIGYSMAGEIIEVGEGVTEFKVGDHVVSTIEHAQYIITSELNCTLCPEGVDMKQAAFWNLAHTGMYCLRQSGLQMGEPAIIMGEGFVGAVTAQLAKIAGACPVILTGHHEEKLAASREMGIDYTVNTKTDPEGLEKLLAELGLENKVPVIFEATGNREALMQAARLIAERGRIIMISQVHGEAMPPIDNDIMQKGVSFIGTYVNSRPYKLKRADLLITGTWPPVMGTQLNPYKNKDMWTADEDIKVYLNYVKYGRLNITPLISHTFDYKEIPEAYDKYVFPHPSKEITGGLICW